MIPEQKSDNVYMHRQGSGSLQPTYPGTNVLSPDSGRMLTRHSPEDVLVISVDGLCPTMWAGHVREPRCGSLVYSLCLSTVYTVCEKPGLQKFGM